MRQGPSWPMEQSAAHRQVWWPWGAAALTLGNLVAHKPISDICDALFLRLGRPAYESVTMLAIGGLSAAGAALLLRGLGSSAGVRSVLRSRILVALGAVSMATLCAQRWLLVSNIELIHLPQFGLVAILLLRGGASRVTAWTLASLAGVVDEVYQHLVIYRGVPHTYLDFNDMLLNAIGAAWAVLLWPRPPDAVAGQRGAQVGRWRLWAGAALTTWLLLLWVDPPAVNRLLSRAATGRSYRVLSASEAFAGFVLLGTLIAWAVANRGAIVIRKTACKY